MFVRHLCPCVVLLAPFPFTFEIKTINSSLDNHIFFSGGGGGA